MKFIFFLQLIFLSCLTSRAAELGTVQMSSEDSCPFQQNKAELDINSLTNKINANLSTFAGYTTCGQGASTLTSPEQGKPLQISLLSVDNAVGSNASVHAFPVMTAPSAKIDGLVMNCINYQDLLTIELNSESDLPKSVARYNACYDVDNNLISGCLDRIYNATLKDTKSICSASSRMRLRDDAYQSLVHASQQIGNAIASNNLCDKSGKQVAKETLLTTAGSLLDSISAVGVASFGLPGLALSAGATLAEGLIRSFSIDDTKELYEKYARDDNNFPQMACLWYRLQKDVINCPRLEIKKGYQSPLCLGYLTGLPYNDSTTTSLKELISNLSRQKEDIQTGSAGNTAMDAHLVDNLNSLMDKNIPDPIRGAGAPIKIKDHLNSIVDYMKNSKAQSDKVNRKSLGDLLSKLDEVNNSNEPANAEQLTAIKKALAELNFPELIDSYWSKQAPKEILTTTEVLNLSDHMLNMKNALGVSTSMGMNQDTTYRITQQNTLVKFSKPSISNRLRLQYERYKDNLELFKKGNNSNAVKDALSASVQLTQICSTMGGILNSEEDSKNIRSPLAHVNENHNSDYDKYCKPVSCLTNQKGEAILLSKEAKGQSFEQYQCNNQQDNNFILKDLNKKYQEMISKGPNPDSSICP